MVVSMETRKHAHVGYLTHKVPEQQQKSSTRATLLLLLRYFMKRLLPEVCDL